MHTPERQYRVQQQYGRLNQKCVCQICTCGKHHCPPTSTKFTGETTNHHDYKPYNITAQRHQPCQQHVYQPRHYDKDSLKTSYKKDYQPYKIQPYHQPYRLQYKPVQRPFYDQTEYKKNYIPREIVVERPMTSRPTQYRNRAKFQGSTTYQAEFSPKKVQRYEQVKPTYERKKAPFYGETSYNSEYKPYEIQMRKSTYLPRQNYQKNPNKFLGESRYHEEYKPYKIQRQVHCPIQVMPQRPNRCSPGKSHLNYSAEKRRWE